MNQNSKFRWITGNPKREFLPRLAWPAVVHEQIILAGQPKMMNTFKDEYIHH